jgi:hypothetical protein
MWPPHPEFCPTFFPSGTHGFSHSVSQGYPQCISNDKSWHYTLIIPSEIFIAKKGAHPYPCYFIDIIFKKK